MRKTITLIVIGGGIIGLLGGASVYIAGEHRRLPEAQIVQAKPIIKESTKRPEISNRNIKHNPPSRAKTYMMLEVTAYSETGFKTASGKIPRPGMCAAEWKHFPKGTALWIEGYGRAVVEDTGGRIKGNRPIPNDGEANLDVYFNTGAKADKWGRRTVRVWRVEGRE